MTTKILKIATEFSDAPGGRYRKHGSDSGEAFREDTLIPFFNTIEDGDDVIIDLDGGYGYGVSFLEESFGGIKRLNNPKYSTILERIRYISRDEPDLINEIKKYIQEAQK